MSRTKRIGIGLTVTALLAGVGIAIMLIGPPPATATTPPQAPRAVPVDVAVVRHMPVRLWTDFSARCQKM